MKKVVIALALMLSASLASAHGPRGYYGGGNVWVPLIVGATAGYVVSQSQRQPVYVYPQPVYQQPAPVVVAPPVVSNVPPGYRYENILDAACGCYRIVLVPN